MCTLRSSEQRMKLCIFWRENQNRGKACITVTYLYICLYTHARSWPGMPNSMRLSTKWVSGDAINTAIRFLCGWPNYSLARHKVFVEYVRNTNRIPSLSSLKTNSSLQFIEWWFIIHIHMQWVSISITRFFILRGSYSIMISRINQI